MAISFLKDTFTNATENVRQGINLIATRDGVSRLVNWWGHAMLTGSLVQSVQYATERAAGNSGSSSLFLTGVGIVGALAGYYARGRATRPSSP